MHVSSLISTLRSIPRVTKSLFYSIYFNLPRFRL